jgi:hypothetical protein
MKIGLVNHHHHLAIAWESKGIKKAVRFYFFPTALWNDFKYWLKQ